MVSTKISDHERSILSDDILQRLQDDSFKLGRTSAEIEIATLKEQLKVSRDAKSGLTKFLDLLNSGDFQVTLIYITVICALAGLVALLIVHEPKKEMNFCAGYERSIYVTSVGNAKDITRLPYNSCVTLSDLSTPEPPKEEKVVDKTNTVKDSKAP